MSLIVCPVLMSQSSISVDVTLALSPPLSETSTFAASTTTNNSSNSNNTEKSNKRHRAATSAAGAARPLYRKRSYSAFTPRRSVLSMKNLLPLALPTTHSLEAFEKPDRGDILMDCNLPELLARDLEISTSLFASKNMTAGPPSACMLSKNEAATTDVDSSSVLARSISPNSARFHGGRCHSLHRVRSLGAIEEKSSVISSAKDDLVALGLEGGEAAGPERTDEKDDEGGLAYDSMSDSNSTSHSSSALEPPSIRRRDNSVITAATSLTSTSFSVAASFGKVSKTSRSSEVLLHGQDSSWIDPDSDVEDATGRDSSDMEVAHAIPIPMTRRRFQLRERMPEEVRAMGEGFVDPFKQHPVSKEVRESLKKGGETSRRNSTTTNKSRPVSRSESLDRRIVDIPKRTSSKNGRSSSVHTTSGGPLSPPPTCPTSPICKAEESPIPPVPALPAATATTATEDRGSSEKMMTEEISRMTRSIQAAQRPRPKPEFGSPLPEGKESHEDGVENDVPQDDDDEMGEEEEIEDEYPQELVAVRVLRQQQQQQRQRRKQKPSLASVHIQNWLESSIEPVILPHPGGDDHGPPSGIPLPPEVVESVRVSITCFPETMLLTSSLSIETIRTYSRKMRNTASLEHRLQTSSGAPSNSSSRSRWGISRVLPRRTNSVVTRGRQPHRHHQMQDSSIFEDGSVTASVAPPPWLPLRNIFNCASGNSDYLCDALYSHIVAYNYISTLARPPPGSQHNPRSPRPNTMQSSSSSSRRDSKEDPTEIPKKAAFLLGIDETGSTPVATPEPTTPSFPSRGRSRLARKRSVGVASLLPPLSREYPERSSGGGGGGGAVQERADTAMRELQIGLAKCIARLVTTMKKMTASGEAADDAISDGVEMDPLFMRSLCEIVRCCEEMPC